MKKLNILILLYWISTILFAEIPAGYYYKANNKYGYDLLVLHYDEYYENSNLYLIPNEKETFTIGSMKKYVRQYFGMIYKINCKRNEK